MAHHPLKSLHRCRDPDADRKEPAQHHENEAGDNESERHPDRGVFGAFQGRLTSPRLIIESVCFGQRIPFHTGELRRTGVEENRLRISGLGRGPGERKIDGVCTIFLKKVLRPGHNILHDSGIRRLVLDCSIHFFCKHRLIISDARQQGGAVR